MPTAFSPSRFVAARLVRKVSRPEIAAALGCSASYVANIEDGKRDGEPVSALIAKALDYPTEYFFGDAIDMPVRASLAFRRKSSMLVGDQDRTRAVAASVMQDILPIAASFIQMPPQEVPDMSIHTGTDPMFVGELAAAEVRQHFSMGNSPLRHVVDLVETLGIAVFWIDAPSEFHGVSFWVKGQPGILLNRNAKDGYRMRFTLLHELGHLVLHRNIEVPGKVEDREADHFASAMLMPRATFQRAMRRYFDPYAMLDDRSIWGASVGAMVRRAFDLKIYNDYEYREAFISMTKLGWKAGEPRPMPVEKSTLHRYFLGEAGEKGLSSFDLADRSRLRYHDFVAAVPQATEFERTYRMGDLFSNL